MRKIVLGLSGGMDSATLLGYFVDNGYQVHGCQFYYGSKHGEFERKAAQALVAHYNTILPDSVVMHEFDLTGAFAGFTSNLLKTGGEIPEGHYESENMKLTVVPGRNLIFASIMAGLAESIGAEAIALGVHSGDHAIYPDCRPEFILALERTVGVSSAGEVTVFAPFLRDNKTSILEKGYQYDIPVPYELTRTCYKEQEHSCGKCGSCQERLEAFSNINKVDPIRYE